MRRPTLLIALTLGAALASVQGLAQTATEASANQRARASRCPRVTVSAAEESNAKGRRRFSAARTTDLVFHVLFRNGLDSEHVVTLKIYTPNGHMYRQYDVPTASEFEKRSNGTRRLEGYAYPVAVQAPSKVEVDGIEQTAVSVPFPVAGSTIITSSLYGRWRVEVYLDGATRPCGKKRFFYIRE